MTTVPSSLSVGPNVGFLYPKNGTTVRGNIVGTSWISRLPCIEYVGLMIDLSTSTLVISGPADSAFVGTQAYGWHELSVQV